MNINKLIEIIILYKYFNIIYILKMIIKKNKDYIIFL